MQPPPEVFVHARKAKYSAEVIGTFFLVFTVGCCVHTASVGAALSVGTMLMVMVFALGSVSGGHFNPAVTLAVALSGRGKILPADAVLYMLSQVAGGLAGAVAHWRLCGSSPLLRPVGAYSAEIAVFLELAYSAGLCYVVLNVATTTGDLGAPAKSLYPGLAVGMTVTAAAIVVGPVSGCSLNPAVSLGFIFTGYFVYGPTALNFWTSYVFAPMGGAVAGFCLFYVVRRRYEYATTQLAHRDEEDRWRQVGAQVPRASDLTAQSAQDAAPEERLSKADLRGTSQPGLVAGESLAVSRRNRSSNGKSAASAPSRREPDGVALLQKLEMQMLSKDVESHNLFAGLFWQVEHRHHRGDLTASVDIDASCVKFDREGTNLGAVYFAEKHDHINGIEHSSSQALGGGSGDSEQISFKLSQLQENVHVLFFVATMFSSTSSEIYSFKDVGQCSVRLVDVDDGNKELLKYEKPDIGSGNALVVAMLFRAKDGWCFKAIDECYQIQDHATYRALESKLHRFWRQTVEILDS